MKTCEWNPLHNYPSSPKMEGNCSNIVSFVIGHDKPQWSLCDQCVKLPIFKRFKFRKKVEQQIEEDEQFL